MSTTEPYAPAVAEYFARATGPGGSDLRGEAGSQALGTHIQFTAGLEDGILTRVGFRVYACPHIIAACHRAAELLENAPAQVLADFDTDGLIEELEIPVEKTGKLLILKDAMRDAFGRLSRRD